MAVLITVGISSGQICSARECNTQHKIRGVEMYNKIPRSDCLAKYNQFFALTEQIAKVSDVRFIVNGKETFLSKGREPVAK